MDTESEVVEDLDLPAYAGGLTRSDAVKDYNKVRAGEITSYRRKVFTGELYDPEVKAEETNEKKETLHEAIKEARQLSIFVARIAGMSHAEIAERFNRKHSTISRYLSDAHKNHLVDLAKEIIIGQLIPKAIIVYEKHLDANSLDAARDVMRGTGALPERGPQPTLAPGEGELTLREIRARFNRGT